MRNSAQKSRVSGELDADRRLLPWAISAVLALYILGSGNLGERYHQFVDKHLIKDWMVADLDIFYDMNGLPAVNYGLEVNTSLQARFTAFIQNEMGDVVTSRVSPDLWSYSMSRPEEITMSWAGFFEIPGRTTPSVPDYPYRVCVSYRMFSTSGVMRDQDPRCSPLVVPPGYEGLTAPEGAIIHEN